ncbi:MAG TPA: hypothetical protein VEI03_23675 [Stellaceae bacterium]|nr:hypothetical protein [Stellaceae bacterium]
MSSRKDQAPRRAEAGAANLRDLRLVPAESGTRQRLSPRIAAPLSVELASRDRRGATLLAGTLGNRPPFQPAVLTDKERRSPGELGPAREARRPPPRAPRRASAAPAGGEPFAAPPSAGGETAPRRREPATPLRAAPTAGLGGLPGLGVFLGELGSPAGKQGPSGADERPPTARMILGRGLRWVPNLVDVSVSIGTGMARGREKSRLAPPPRALIAKRLRPAPAGAVMPAPSPSAPADTPAVAAASARGRLRRAARYIVNGILDVAIRRFRAGAPSARVNTSHLPAGRE